METPRPDQSGRTSHERMRMGSGISTLSDPIDAANQATQRAQIRLGSDADLVIGFITPPFTQRVGMIADAIRARVSPKHMILVSAHSIMSDDHEVAGAPGISLMMMRLPGVQMHPYILDATWGAMDPSHRAARAAETLGVSETMACSLFFADPFSVPMVNLIPAMSDSRVEYSVGKGESSRIGTIIGGLASGAQEPGHNTLFIDGQIRNYGAIGITLSGNIQVDTIVSQGCKPVGEPMVVTKARGNLILELGGVPAIQAIRDSLAEIDPGDQGLLENGLLLGRVINESQARFGRGDFLIRNIMGGDENTGAIAIADLVHAGQTVQPHLHDAQTAREDLELLLNAQQLYDRPAGALVVSCTGRSQEFFGEPGHDARAIRRAFQLPIDGPNLAKAGKELSGPDRGIPLVGFHASGEIGPVGNTIFQHGHTLVAALFREPEDAGLWGTTSG